jgi:riboflavin kinase/FMN adenylyltransferase
VNIGVRPSLHDGHATPLVEAHLLDFNGDLYQRKITVVPFRRLRTERRFETPEELRVQILKDVADARGIVTSRLGQCSEVKPEAT